MPGADTPWQKEGQRFGWRSILVGALPQLNRAIPEALAFISGMRLKEMNMVFLQWMLTNIYKRMRNGDK
ncbi:MAG: hypothetical protein E6556_00450 [Pantoea sp.]|nr:hypothetical protein [Pantoea sp.]